MRARRQPLKATHLLAWIALLAAVLMLVGNWPRGPRSVAKRTSTESTAAPATSAAPAAAPAPAPKPAPRQRPVEAQVMVDLLNFRAKKDLRDQAIIGPLTRGTIVKVLKKERAWLHVELADGRRGYIAYSPRYVRFTKMEAE